MSQLKCVIVFIFTGYCRGLSQRLEAAKMQLLLFQQRGGGLEHSAGKLFLLLSYLPHCRKKIHQVHYFAFLRIVRTRRMIWALSASNRRMSFFALAIKTIVLYALMIVFSNPTLSA